MRRKGQWFRATRTLQTLTQDQLRTRSQNIGKLFDGTILLLVRQEDKPIVQYVFGDPGNIAKAGELSGFSVTPLKDGEEPELPEGVTVTYHPLVPWRARLNSISNMEKLRSDMQEVRQSVETLIPPDSFVSITVRRQGFFENYRIRDWVSSEGSTVEDGSDYVKAGSMCARVVTGCASSRDGKATAVNVGQAVFPRLSAMQCHRSVPRLGLPVLGVLLTVLTFLAAAFTSLPTYTVLLPIALTVIGGVRFARRTIWDDIERFPRHRWFLKRQRLTKSSDTETPLGGTDRVKARRAYTLGYPTQRTTLLLAPMATASLFTPLGAATAMTQELHQVPDVLSYEGVYLGKDQTGRGAYLDPTQLFGGVAITGEPMSGKSVLAHGIVQWAKSNRDTSPASVWGRDSRIIDFEMKDDGGVRVLQSYGERHGLRKGNVTYLSDPGKATIDLLGMLDGKDARATAVTIARTMQYSFEKGDIMNDSLDVITSAMTIGVACDRYMRDGLGDIAEKARRLESKYPGAEQISNQKSPVGWAVVALAAGDGQTGSARALGHVCRSLALETKSPDMVLAAKAAEQLYGRPDSRGHVPISDQRLLDMTKASRNKVRQLLDCEHVFTGRRGRISWASILRHPGDYHIVLTPHDGHKLPEGMTKILGAWLLYGLWNTITDMCQGWQARGKHTMIVCDELSMLANSDDLILSSIREQGRAFGVIPVFATQYPRLLSDRLLDSFMGYVTFVTFNTSNDEVAKTFAARLTDNDGEDGWTGGVVKNLPRYTAAVRTRTQEQIQPSFLVKTVNFDSQSV